MPRLVRREPLADRVKAYLNPYDFLLWLSEELHESAWDEALKDWAGPLGFSANVIFIIARANSGSVNTGRRDDLFGDVDGRGGIGWFVWLAAFTAHLLALVSFLNAVYTFMRRRHYRLFESSVDQPPSTPSARRVRVDSSPIASSPLRYISSVLASATAGSRAHPDQQKDVWEVGVWDPKELNLELFTYFSPGHVLIYWLFLPTASLDPRPSVTVFTAILLGALFTLQLVALRVFFTQQAKDSRLIQKEVMNEYDTKFVHPTLNKPVRDVGTQTRETTGTPRTKTREVDVYTPTTIINRGFQVNPNLNYSSHLSDDLDADTLTSPSKRLPRSSTTSALRTPMNGGLNIGYTSFVTQPDPSPSPLKPRQSLQPRDRSPLKPRSNGDGGSLGVYSHSASPLRKAASSGYLRPGTADADARAARLGSPLKRTSFANDGSANDDSAGYRLGGSSALKGRRETGRY